MAQKLVGQQAAVWIFVGASQATGNINSVNAVSATALIGYAKKITKSDDTVTADMSALGDTRVTTQVLRGKTDINFELLVPTTGEQFGNAIGSYAKIFYRPNAAASNVTYIGVITKQSVDFPDGAQTEMLTVTCDAN
jgi:hypothetical protein